jgi:hypothetical protein
MNRKKFVNLMCFYNFFLFFFSVGCVSMIASPSEKEVLSFHEVQSSGLLRYFSPSLLIGMTLRDAKVGRSKSLTDITRIRILAVVHAADDRKALVSASLVFRDDPQETGLRVPQSLGGNSGSDRERYQRHRFDVNLSLVEVPSVKGLPTDE